jgi:Gp49-like protein DUF891
MPSIGKGVEEIRVWDDSGSYRVMYTARLTDAVVVLHAFQKKTQATAKQGIEIAKEVREALPSPDLQNHWMLLDLGAPPSNGKKGHADSCGFPRTCSGNCCSQDGFCATQARSYGDRRHSLQLRCAAERGAKLRTKRKTSV